LSRSASDEPEYAGQGFELRKFVPIVITRTLDGDGGPKKFRSIVKIGLELALFLELGFGTRIEHCVLVVFRLAILCSKPGLALGLLLCELLLESSFFLGRSYLRSGGCRLPLFLIG
jgi:hypothetical protein